MKSKQINHVSIAINSKMFARYEDLPNTTSHVLAEFIDNALQSYRDNKDELLLIDPDYRLSVNIEIDWNENDHDRACRFVITDNAAGIDSDKFENAFESAATPDDDTGLNEFGMGLKTAVCWLGKDWSVRTTALGEDVERTINFDQDEVINNNLESEPVESKSVHENAHYTVVTVWNPTKNVPSRKNLGKITKEIASIYRQPLRNEEIEIIVCGEKVLFQEYEILYAPVVSKQGQKGEPIYWKKDIDFTFSKYSAKGFVGILKDINKDNNGFVLMRRGRVIMGAEEGGRYFPRFIGTSGTFKYKRIFGELELDGFDVSFYKYDIQDKENLETLMDIVKDKIHQKDFDLLAQAEDYRVDDTIKKVKKIVRKHNTAPQKDRTSVPSVTEAESVIDRVKDESNVVTTSDLSIIDQYNDTYSINGDIYTMEVIFSMTDQQDLFWLDIKKEKENIITCIINSSHPYFEQFGQTDAAIAIIKSLAVAKFTARKYGDNMTSSMMEYFNEFIRQTKV